MAGGRYIVELDVVFRASSLSLAHRIAHHIEEDIRTPTLQPATPHSTLDVGRSMFDVQIV
jgi:hypothetical protein